MLDIGDTFELKSGEFVWTMLSMKRSGRAQLVNAVALVGGDVPAGTYVVYDLLENNSHVFAYHAGVEGSVRVDFYQGNVQQDVVINKQATGKAPLVAVTERR